MAVLYPASTLLVHFTLLVRSRQLLYPTRVRGKPKEDKFFALEARQTNVTALRPLALLYDACE